MTTHTFSTARIRRGLTASLLVALLLPSLAWAQTLTVPRHAIENQSFTISWSGGDAYVFLDQRVGSGAWSQVSQHGPSGSRQLSRPVGTYTYRIRNCRQSGSGPTGPSFSCSPWPIERTISVTRPITAPSSLSASVNYATGRVTLTWPNSSGPATHYVLQQSRNNGNWTHVTSASGNSASTTVLTSGSYRWRIQPCYSPAGTCFNSYRTSATQTLSLPPVPALGNFSNTSTTGNFTVSWGSVARASRYVLQENGTSLPSSTSLSRGFSGKTPGVYTYRVMACNFVGCSSYSSTKTVTVLEDRGVQVPPTPSLAQAPEPPAGIDSILTLPGEFNVSGTGMANYHIPIATAPAAGNLVPNISLNYSSGAGNGMAGYGWSIGGLGSISRCRQTEAQDKNALPINWGANDRFCLNGERLLVTNGSYGSPGSQYRTESDRNLRVTASGGSAGTPEYFKVEHKDGAIHYYGSNRHGAGGSNNAKQRVVRGSASQTYRWLISRKEDSAGNSIEYGYHNPGEGVQPRIHVIDYAIANGGPNAELVFYWEVRQDKTRGYIAGYEYHNEHRLREIRSLSSGELRRYELNYHDDYVSVNDRVSRLDTIVPCVGSLCGQATVFEWDLPVSMQFDAQAASSFDVGFERHIMGDITGNGLQDLIWLWGGRLHQALASLDADGKLQYTERSIVGGPVSVFGGTSVQMRLIDYNGDGRMDLVAGGFTYRSEPQADGTWSLSGNNPLTLDPTVAGDRALFVDITGNGLLDMVGRRTLRARLHMSSEYGEYYDPLYINFWHPDGVSSCIPQVLELHPTTGDFNGNGRVDFIAATKICTTQGEVNRYLLYTSEQLEGGGLQLRYYDILDDNLDATFGDNGELYLRVSAVDFNNDGLSDLVYDTHFDTETYGSHFYYRLNTGSGLGPMNTVPTLSGPWHKTSFVDLNGDGHPDMVTAELHATSSARVRFRRWDPMTNDFQTHFGSIAYPFPALGLNQSVQFKDVNGNGYPDMVVSDTEYYHGNYNFVVIPHIAREFQQEGTRTAPNRITEIHDGNEITYIDYEPLGQSNHYSFLRGVGNNTHETVCQSTAAGNNCWSREVAATTKSALQTKMERPFAGMSSGNARLEGDLFLHRVFNVTSSMPVVTNVSRRLSIGHSTNPGSVNANSLQGTTSYYYEHGRMQASGRGFLGFRKVTEVNRLSGNRRVTEYRQDWPFTGSPLNVTQYSRQGRKLMETANEWSLAACTSQACVTGRRNQVIDGGTANASAIRPYLRRTERTEYALASGQGAMLGRTVSLNTMNAHGNITQENEAVYDQNNEVLLSRLTDNSYQYRTPTYSMTRGRLTRQETTYTNGLGNITRTAAFTYYQSGTAVGLVETETIEPDNSDFTVTTTHHYDDFGNRVQSNITADGMTRLGPRIEYDDAGRYPQRIYDYRTAGSETTQAEFLRTHFVTHDIHGRPTATRHYVSANQYVTERVATTPFGTPYFQADSTGKASSITAGLSHAQCPSAMRTRRYELHKVLDGAETLVCYDRHGRVVREGQRMLDNRWSLADTEYDRQGRVLRKSEPYYANEGAAYWTRYQYDVLSRRTDIYHPDTNSPTRIRYTGNWKDTTNPLNQTRRELTNALGQIVETVGAVSGTNIYYAYDARGNLRTMTGPGGTTTVAYDLLDRKESMDDPDKGVWSYQYNGFGQLTCQTDAKGQRTVMRYDRRGRLYNRRDATGGTCASPSGIQSNTTWTYDTATNGYGQLSLVVDTISGYEQQSYYDGFGRPRQSRTRLPGVNGQLQNHYERITYDAYGRVFQSFDAARSNAIFDDNGVQHLYQNGYLQRLVDAVYVNGQPRQTYYRAQDMDARGNVTRALYGNGVTRRANHDAATGRIKNLRANNTLAAPIQDLTLTWDDAGNLESRTEIGLGSGISARNLAENYDYDTMNRLTEWRSSGVFEGTENYHYNTRDNMTFKTGVGSYAYGSSCSGANAGPHAVCRVGSGASAINYAYDNNGNMISGGGRSLSYSVFNKPTQISKGSHTTTIAYGPDRARYKRVDTSGSHTTTTLYIGSVEKIHYPDSTVHWRRSIGNVAIINQKFNAQGGLAQEERRYLIHDHLGTLALVTDHNGWVNQELYFDPWGQPRKPQWNGQLGSHEPVLDQPFLVVNRPTTMRGFTEHEHLDEVGIIHMNGRIYDPHLARFLQADPIVQDPTTPRSLNRYSYVWNNPLNATDPSGYVRSDRFARNCFSGGTSMSCGGATPDNNLDQRDRGREIDIELPELSKMLAEAQSNRDTSKNSVDNGGGSVTLEHLGTTTAHHQDGNNTVAAEETSGINEIVVTGERVDGSFDDDGGGWAQAQGGNNYSNNSLGPWAVAALPLAGAAAVSDGPLPIGDLVGGALLLSAVALDQSVKTHLTYTLSNAEGKIYVGRTSGYGDPYSILRRRSSNHHMSRFGFGSPQIDAVSAGVAGRIAIRGREQQKLNSLGGAGSPGVGNSIRGVSRANPAGRIYHDASTSHFGEISQFDGFF